jgi:hypothetical protein
MTYNPQYPQGQYQPGQYQPLNYGTGYVGQTPLQTLLGPAKRAGISMIVLASLILLCGLCVGGVSFVFNESVWNSLQQSMAQQGQAIPPEFDRATIQAVVLGFGIVGIVLGAITMTLGIFTLKGGKVPAILSAVLIGLFIVFQLINLVGSAIGVASDPSGIVNVLIVLGILSFLVLILVWLIQAINNADQVAALKLGGGYPNPYQQYPQQYQQPYQQPYQQQQPPQQPPQQ